MCAKFFAKRLFAKGCKTHSYQFEMRKPEGNADDGKAAANPSENVRNGKPKSSENDPQEVGKAGTGDSFLADKPTVN